MQRNLSAVTTDPKRTRSASQATDNADFFRRLDRRRQRRPAWMTAVAIGVLAIVAAGGVIAYQTMLAPSAPPHQAQTLFITPGR
jgi:hypothetical protein